MDGPTREELDAKLAASEARNEARFAELNGKIDRVADSIIALGAAMRTEIGTLKTEVADLRSDNKYTRWTIVIVLVASLLAAIAALWVTQANLLAAFSAGIALRTETRQAPAAAQVPPQAPPPSSH